MATLLEGYKVPTQGTVTVKKPTTVAKSPYPTYTIPTWKYGGKIYTSYSQYQAAIRAGLALQAQANATLLRKRREAAAKLAAQRGAYAKFAAAQKLRFSRQAQQARNAAYRARHTAQQAQLTRAALARQRDQEQYIRRAREVELAANRKAAWKGLARRQDVIMGERVRRQQESNRRLGYDYAARKLEEADRPVVNPRFGNTGRGVRVLPGRDRSAGARRRTEMLAQAAETGDYGSVMDWIERQARLTGGRYVDQRLYRAAVEAYDNQVDAVVDPYNEMSERINALAVTDPDKARALYDSAEYQALIKQVDRLKGDGRKPGEYERFAQQTASVARLRESYLERVQLGAYANRDLTASDEGQVARFRERYASNGPPRGLKDWIKWGADMRAASVYQGASRSASGALRQAGWQWRPRIGWVKKGSDGEEWARVDENTIMPLEDYKRRREVERMLRIEGMPPVNWQYLVGLANMAADGRFDVRAEAKDKLISAIERMVRAEGQSKGRSTRFSLYGQTSVETNRIAQDESARIDEILGWFEVERDPVSSIGRTPIAGQLMGAMSAGWGLLNATMRETNYVNRGQAGGVGGLITLPEVRVIEGNLGVPRLAFGRHRADDTFTEGWVPWDITDMSGTNKADFEKFYQDYRDAIAAADERGFIGGMGARAAAWNEFAGGMRTGNLGILFDTVLDPLSFVGPARFVRAGALAMAEAGGVRAALRGLRAAPLQTTRPILRNYARFVAPEWMGGANRGERAIVQTYRSAALHSGEPYDVIKGMGTPELIALVEGAGKGKSAREMAEHLEGFGALFKRRPVAAQQLLGWAQDEFMRTGGLLPDPVVLNRAIKEGLRARDEAEAALKLAAQVEVETQQRIAAQQALAAQRVAREALEPGAPLASQAPIVLRPRAATGGAQRKLNRLAAAVNTALHEQAAVARRAADAAEILHVRENIKPGARLEAYRELRSALQELDMYRDMPPGWQGPQMRGGVVSISKRRAELQTYRASQGVSEGRLSYGDLNQGRIRGDHDFVISQLRQARAELKVASSPARQKAIRARIARLNAALEGLKIERQVSKRGEGVVARLRRSKAAQIAAAYRPQRIARNILAPGAQAAELARDLYVRYAGRQVEPSVSFTARQRARLQATENVLRRETLQQTPEIQDFLDIARGTSVPNMNLAEAMELVQYMRRDYVDFATYSDVIDEIERAVGRVLRNRNIDPDDYANWMAYGHEAGKVIDLDEYRRLDELVRDQVRDITGTQRKGAYRAGRASSAPATGGAQVMRDTDPLVLLMKIRLLKKEGYSLTAYDEARSALGEISRRDLIGQELAKQAVASKTGDDVAEFLRLREGRRQREGELDLEQYVNENIDSIDSSVMGMGDEAFFSAWEESHRLGDTVLPKRGVTGYQERVLRESFRNISKVDPDDMDAVRTFLSEQNAPPFDTMNRSKISQWLVDNGFWTKKTAEDIASGERVWSIADEREFWETNYGWTPDWTNEDILRPLMDSPQEYIDQMQKWGFLENDFEKLSIDQNLDVVRTSMDAIAFGGNGVKKARTYEELRDWFIQRYGRLITERDGKTLNTVPWMMTMPEYQSWFGRMAESQQGLKALGLDVIAPLPGMKVKKLGREIDVTLADPEAFAGLSKAIREMVPRHLERVKEQLTKQGVDSDVWLPEERVRFAYEIVDALLTDQDWRSYFARMPIGERMLAVASLQRLLVTWSPAFFTMNAIDSFGPKAALLSLMRNRGRWIHAPKEHWHGLFTKAEIDATAIHTWGTRPAYTRIGDAKFDMPARARAGAVSVAEFPMRVSARAEGVLRYNTAISIAGRVYDDLIKTGMDPDRARALARLEAMRNLKTFFSVLEGASDLELALNAIFPFLTYNYKNSLMGLRILYEMPWVFQVGQRIGHGIEERNRAMWAEEYPGVDFPEGHPDAQKFWISDGADGFYAIDFSMFSDWSRAIDNLTDENRDFLSNFFRVPHPVQTAIFGMFTGGMTAWGKKADWTQLHPFLDFLNALTDDKDFDPLDKSQLDAIQWMSKMAFFKEFGHVTPVQAEVMTWAALMKVDEAKAWEYYRSHPDLEAYFQMDGTGRPFDTRRLTWHAIATDAEIAEYNRAYAGFKETERIFDGKVDQFYLEPWSREYREYRRLSRAAKKQYMKDHPILAQAWAFNELSGPFEQLQEQWKVELEIDDYFSMKPPKRAEFDTDLAYAEAQLKHLTARERYLDQHPAVAEFFNESHNSIQKAWFDQEQHWAEILQQQARVSIAIATEEAKPEPDRDLISFLHDVSEQNYKRLDQESFGQFYDYLNADFENRPGLGERGLDAVSRMMGRIKQVVTIPGRGDFFYEIASDTERKQIVVDEKYYAGLGSMMDELKRTDSFDQFWTELKRKGLLERYLRENPGKRIDYDYSVNIARIFAKGGHLKFWDNLMAEPKWLKMYLSRPSENKTIAEKQATYQRVLVGKRYFNGISAVWDRLNGDFTRFYDELAKDPWVQSEYFRRNPEKAGRRGGTSAYGVSISALYKESKDGLDFVRRLEANPALQAEYFRRNPDAKARWESGKEYFKWMQRWVGALQANDSAEASSIWEAMPEWVKERYFSSHPEARKKIVGNTAYSAAMGKWVDLLKAGKNEEAEKYFNSLPEPFKERYYKKHPDQRAKGELGNEMLRIGAEYFLAHPDDQLRILQRYPQFRTWLNENGGKEAEMRGLMFAIYRAIPSSDAWLKRKFRDTYPEYFSPEAAGLRKIKRVNAELAKHPEMIPYYEKALAIQVTDYTEQLRLNKQPPKPLTMERKSRLKKRRKRRAARIHSRWKHFMEKR